MDPQWHGQDTCSLCQTPQGMQSSYRSHQPLHKPSCPSKGDFTTKLAPRISRRDIHMTNKGYFWCPVLEGNECMYAHEACTPNFLRVALFPDSEDSQWGPRSWQRRVTGDRRAMEEWQGCPTVLYPCPKIAHFISCRPTTPSCHFFDCRGLSVEDGFHWIRSRGKWCKYWSVVGCNNHL